MDKSLDKVIKRHIILTVLTGFAVVLMMIAITYGIYQTNHENTTDQQITVGNFDVDITSSSGQITLSNLIPGVQNNTTYTFTTSNSGDYTVDYSVFFTDNTTVFLASGNNATTYSAYTQISTSNYAYIYYILDNGTAKTLSSIYDSTTGRFTILTGTLSPGDSNTHTVKFYVASNAPNSIQGSILALNITMEATLQNGSSPSSEYATDTIMNLVSGEPTNTTAVITKTAPSGATCTNTLAYDGTSDNNLRYVGANPCNYVTFNGEVHGWRIIGVMNNIDNSGDVNETRIKLARASTLGNYSYDSSANGVNSGWGVNDWTQADLKNELNGDYLNANLSSNTSWYNGRNEQLQGTFDYTKRIQNQTLIADAKYYLGGVAESQNDMLPTAVYASERGTTVLGNPSGTCNDGYCPRATEWVGKVAIPYLSDYSYATAGGTTTSRSDCLTTVSHYASGWGGWGGGSASWTNSSYTDCMNNDWLKPSSDYMHTLTPFTSSAYRVHNVFSSTTTSTYYIDNAGGVLPVFYLKPDAVILSGDGSIDSPYTFG